MENKKRSLKYYYENREKRIQYQREYDRTHKEIKRAYDKKRNKTKTYNKKKCIQHYSQRVHLPKLMKMYSKCQLCNSTERLQIHHKRYSRRLKDCMLVCEKCHKRLHRKILII